MLLDYTPIFFLRQEIFYIFSENFTDFPKLPSVFPLFYGNIQFTFWKKLAIMNKIVFVCPAAARCDAALVN